MKHLKSINENNQVLFSNLKYYYDILKNSTDYFTGFVINQNNTLKQSNSFAFSTDPSKNSKNELVTFEISLMIKGSIMNIDIDDFENIAKQYVSYDNISTEPFETLSDLLYYMSLPAKQLRWHAEWKDIEVQIWKYAIEQHPDEALDCPAEILDILKNKLANPKRYGIFD